MSDHTHAWEKVRRGNRIVEVCFECDEVRNVGREVPGKTLVELFAPECPGIVFAADCPPCACCGEPWCEKHQQHYADCPCLGPDSETEP